MNAVDYLLKPVERSRLREALNRAQERLERAMPGGTYVATLSNGRQLSISRLQGRILRERLLKL